MSVAFSKGKTHDFRLFKDNCRNIREDIWVIADKGYCGIFDIHFKSLIPVKTSKNHRLTDTERAFNSALSRHRIFIEHINRYIKRFRILSSRYRNRHRRLFLRVNLICSIYNLQHCI